MTHILRIYAHRRSQAQFRTCICLQWRALIYREKFLSNLVYTLTCFSFKILEFDFVQMTGFTFTRCANFKVEEKFQIEVHT